MKKQSLVWMFPVLTLQQCQCQHSVYGCKTDVDSNLTQVHLKQPAYRKCPCSTTDKQNRKPRVRVSSKVCRRLRIRCGSNEISLYQVSRPATGRKGHSQNCGSLDWKACWRLDHTNQCSLVLVPITKDFTVLQSKDYIECLVGGFRRSTMLCQGSMLYALAKMLNYKQLVILPFWWGLMTLPHIRHFV